MTRHCGGHVARSRWAAWAPACACVALFVMAMYTAYASTTASSDAGYLRSRAQRLKGVLAGYLMRQAPVALAALRAESAGRYEEALALYRRAKDGAQSPELGASVPPRSLPEILELDIGRCSLALNRYAEADIALSEFALYSGNDSVILASQPAPGHREIVKDRPKALELLSRAQRRLATATGSWKRFHVLAALRGNGVTRPMKVELVSPTITSLNKTGPKYMAVYWRSTRRPDLVTYVSDRELAPRPDHLPGKGREDHMEWIGRPFPMGVSIIFTYDSGDCYFYEMTRNRVILISTGD